MSLWLTGGALLVPRPLVEQAVLLGYAQYRASCPEDSPGTVFQSFQCDGGWDTVLVWPFSPLLKLALLFWGLSYALKNIQQRFWPLPTGCH